MTLSSNQVRVSVKYQISISLAHFQTKQDASEKIEQTRAMTIQNPIKIE